jgi:methionine-rich copper-binding protein CopC
LAWDNNGNILAAEANSNVRLVTLAGVVTTLPLFANAPSLSPHQNTIVQTRDGNYVGMVSAPVVRVSTPDGNSTVVSGGSGSSNGLNRVATFSSQRGGVATPDGKVYISDSGTIRTGTLYPSLLNPGAQSTTLNTRLAFSNANLAQLGATANDTDQNNVRLPITLTLSAQFGTLDLGSVAAPNGVTVTFAPGNRSVTLTGSETAIQTHLLNFGYTPDAGYVNANSTGGTLASGAVSPDVLSMSVTTANNTAIPVTGSLNLVVKGDNTPRIVSPLPDKTYLVESVVSTETAITLTIADGDTANTVFVNNATTGGRITATSDNPNLILPADIATAIGGSGSARTFTVKHQANITGVANVTITINDGTNQSVYTFKVTVVPTPNYYWGILAGSASGTAGSANGTGTAAGFNNPLAMVMDPDGNLIVGDNNNFRIRKITPAGVVTTLAGSGANGSTLNSAQSNTSDPMTTIFPGINGLAMAPNRDIYVSDAWSNAPGSWIARIRVVRWDTATNAYKQTETLSESIPWGGGPGLLYAHDNSGLFVPTQGNSIQKFTFSGSTFSTLAGLNGGSAGTTDGTGSDARFSGIEGISFDSNNDILVNQQNGAIRKVTLQGVVTTVNPNLTTTNSFSNVLPMPGGAYLRSNNAHALLYAAYGDTATIAGSTANGSAVGVNLNATFNMVRSFVAGLNGTVYLTSKDANNIRVGTPYPSLRNPGAQSTNIGTRLAFNSADLSQLGAVSNAVDSNNNPLPITLTLSAQFGTLDLGSVAAPNGVTVTFAPGNRSVTLTGSETAIRTHLLNFGYTPDAGYVNANSTGGTLASGAVSPDVLSMSVTTANNTAIPVTGSLNLLVKGDNTPRIVSPLPDRMYYAETGIATETAITLTIADGDTANTVFVNNATTGGRITATSDNPNLILTADIATAIGGSGSARTFTVKHQANITGVANVTITINDGTNQSVYTFKVTVVPTPNYYWGILAGSAGGAAGSANGTGTAASFNAPQGLVRDSQGNLFVAEYNNHAIRKITPQGVVTTFAGTVGSAGFADGTGTAARFNQPANLAIDAQDNLYVADFSNSRIRKITPAGVVTTLAGTGTGGSADGPASSATFIWPSAIAATPAGVVYVGDQATHTIRKIENGQVTTIAGSAGSAGNTDGIGTAARFNAPAGAALTPSGMLLVRDYNSGAIRQLDLATNQVTTFATSTGANFMGVNVDSSGLLYAGLASNTISLISSFDRTTLVGTGTAGSTLGVNTAATIADPRQMAFTPDGTIYLASAGQHNIRVGTPYPSLKNPGTQSTTEATRLAFSSANLQQLGAFSNALNTAGTASLPISLKLSVQFGTLDFNNVAAPNGVTVSGAGTSSVTVSGDETAVNNYMANFGYTPNAGYINANTTGGALASVALSPDVLSLSVTTANNTASPVTGSLNLVVRAADNRPRIVSPLPDRMYYAEPGVATETAITLTLADADTAASSFTNNATTGGRITATSDNPNLILTADMLTSIGGSGSARTFTVKHQANVTGVANVTITINDGTNQSVYTFKVTVVPTPNYYWGILAGSAGGATGSANGTGTAASFNNPAGLVRDSQGNLYVSDNSNHVIRKITPQGVVTTFAGTVGSASFADGTGATARFNAPLGLAIDAQDNIYVADQSNNRIRRITPAGVVTTVAGSGGAGSADGAAATATFNLPTGVAINAAGDIFVGDRNSHTIRKISGGQVTTLAGLAGNTGFVDGVGSVARFNAPGAIHVTPAGMLLVRDINNSGRIRQVDPVTGAVTTLYTANANMWADGGVDSNGLLYAPLSGNTISLISSFDTTVLVGNGSAGTALGVNTAATVSDARQVAFAPDRTIYFSNTGAHNIRVGTPYPSLKNPGTQSTNEAIRLAFSSANLQQLGAFSNALNTAGTATLPISLKLSVQFGTLDFNNVAVPNGVTVTGVGTSTVTVSGDETAVNNYMANFGYTPNTGYINANASGGALASGALSPDVLSLSVTTANNTASPVTGSLNLVVRAADNRPRIVSPLPDRMYYAEPGVATETAITLTLADADTAATSFVNNASTGARITVTSDNPNLILPADMLTSIGGSGSARTFTVKHQANITGVANVTITINDGVNQSTYTFRVTVVPTPQYYWGILAGSATGAAGSANGTGTSASFNAPNGMVRDSQGNLFVAEYSANLIRKITPQGVVTTFAGAGGAVAFADGTGAAAKFNLPLQMAIDANDNIYLADSGNNRIRKITPAGVVTTLAGTGTGSSVDGGVASATFNEPTGIAINPGTGVIYVSEQTGRVIRKIENGQVTTVAGLAATSALTNGFGTAARFESPHSIVLLPNGNLLVRDVTSAAFRLFNTVTTEVTTLTTGTTGFNSYAGVDAQGRLYLPLAANQLTLTSDFDSVNLVGSGTAGSVLGVNTAATISDPRSLVFAPDGTAYLVSRGQNNIRVGSPIPSLANPGKQAVGDTQLLTFANASTQRLSIQSNGAAEPLTLTLAVTRGKVTLSQLTGLTFTAGDGTADATMTFSGTVADINAALNNLVYDFDELANPSATSDTLTLTTPWSAGGTSGNVVQTVPIQIVKAPVITPITNILVGVGGTITPAAFTVTDADTAANALTYTITSSNTNLIPNSGLVRTGGTGATGSTAPANAQNSLAITPTTNRTGITTVTIAVSDGNITTNTTFTVTVSPIVGAPDLISTSDTGSSSTDNITSDNTPTFSVTLGTGIQAGDVVGIYNGSTKIGEAIVTSADILAGSIQITTSPIMDGSYSNITSSVVFGTDRGIASAALSPQLLIDSTAPGTPTGLADLATASDTGSSTTDNITNDTTPTFSIPLAGTGAVAGDVIELYNGSTLIGTYTLTAGDIIANGASLTTNTLPAGTYSDVKFRIVDTAGNASAYSGSMSPALVIDLGAPTLVTLSPADNATNLVPPTTLVMIFNEDMAKGVTGTIVIKKTSDNSTVETFNVATSSRVMVTGSKVTLLPATTLEYGTGYYVTVDSTALTDTAGNTYAGLANATDWNFTTLSIPGAVDLTSASDAGASSTDNITNLTSIDIDVALNPGTQVGDVIKLYDGVTLVGSVTVDSTMLGNGKVTFNLANQTAGVHSYSATLSNGAGESPATAALIVTIDTTAPTAPSMSLDPASDTGTQGDGKTKDSTPTLNGNAEPGSVINLYINGSTTPVSVIADSNGNWTYTPTTPLADGSHSIVATQTDPAGNTSLSSAPILFNIDTTAPVATATSPADGSTVSPPSSISITFDEPVVLGSFGSVTIWDDTNNTSLVIPFSNSQLSVNGNELTITPTTPFAASTNYHVEIGSGVIRDVSGNLYAGISNTTDWNFTTNSAPATPTMDLRASSDTGFSNTDNKTNATSLIFDIKVPAGAVAGDIINVYDGTNPTPVGTITLASGDITAGTVALTLSGVSAGIHSYTSTLTRSSDSLVSDPSTPLVLDISTTAPSAPVITPLAPTNDNTPTLNGTAPANSKVDIYDANNNLIGTTNADANGNWSFTPSSPLPDGNYQLNAKATDVYGNTSPASTPVNLVIDTVAPAKPVITLIGPDNGASTTDKITSANILTITGTAEANSIVTIYDNGIKIGTATTNSSGQWTFTTPTLADGSNRFSANATDAIGNKSVNADSYTMVIDSSAPSAPVINPLPSPLNDTTPNLSGTGEPGAIITISDGANAIGTAVVDANGNWTFTPSSPLSDGSHTFTATQKDAAGNTSPTSNSVTTNIDSVPPAAPVITPPLAPTNDNTPTLNGTAEPNSIIKIYDGTNLIGTATTDGNGDWTFTPTTPLSDGVHNLSASSTDEAGNISPVSDVVPYTIDTVLPLATNFNPAPGETNASIYDNLVVTFSEPIAFGSTGTIELRDSSGTLIESFSVSSSRLSISGNNLTIDPTANLALGTSYYVTMGSGSIKDLAGNAFAGISSNTDWAFTTSALPIPPAPSGIDLQPASDTGSSNSDNITSDNTPTLDIGLNTNGLNAGDIVRLYDNGVEVGSVTLTAADIAAGKVSITTSTLADGTHSLTSKIEDTNGTLSSASAPLSVVINTVPPSAPGTPDLAATSDTGSSSTDNITSIKTPTFNGTGNPGDTISLYVDGVLAGTGVVDANGNYSITPSSPIADGVHSITTSATNVAGLTGPLSSPLSMTIDSTPPATPTSPADLASASDTGRSSSDNITSDTTPDFGGTGLTPGNTVVLYVDGQPAGTATVDANGNWTVNVSPALVDGSHTITYLVKDPAGNSSGFAPTMNITVDTAVPTKPSVPTLAPASDTGLSATDRITNDNTPTINGTGGIPGNDVTLKDGSGNIIGTGIVAADGTWSITPTTPLVDGNYNFTATYTSVSGVSSLPSDPISVVIDTVVPSAPAAPTISPINPSATPGHTNSTTPVFTGGTFLPGELVQLFIDGSSTPAATAIVDANGNYQIISPTLTDGSHTFAVKVTDAAGNISAASNPTTLVIDSRQPGSPTTPDLTAATDTGTSNTDNITSDNTPDFRGVVDATSTAQAGDFVEIYSGTTLVGVGTVVLDTTSGNLVWSVTVGTTASGYTLNPLGATTLADGTQAISAMFRTPGGFGSQLSQALTVVVDTTAPTAPSSAPDLAASSDMGNSSTDNLTNDTTPTFTGTGGVPGDTVNLYANGNLIGSAVVGPDGSYSVTPTSPLADGTYDFKTNFVDPAGNTSGFSPSLLGVVIDSTPPAVPPTPDLVASSDTGASNSDNITADNTPTFEGFGTPGDTINIYVDGVLAGSTTVDVNGNWSITANSIADGVHQVTSQAVDPAGNASAQSTPLVLTIDTTAPNAPIFTTPSGPTSNSQPPISGTGEPGSIINLYDGPSLVGTAIVNGDGTWSITPTSPLADGTHTFTSTATDGAGNVSPTSSPINITIDTVNPLPPVVVSVSQDTGDPSDKITSDKTLTITGTAEPGSTITLYDGITNIGTVVVGPDGTYSVTTSALSDGSHPLSITSTDAAGNISQPVGIGTWVIDSATPTAPTFGSVSQDTGANTTDKITSDNTLTVTGLAGSAEPGTTITVYDSSSGSPVAVGTAVVAQDGSYSVTTSALSDGNHPLSITSTDTAGNQSSPTSLGIWSIDTAAPNAPSFGSISQDTGVSANDKNTSDNTLTITGNAGAAEPGSTITVYDSSSGSPIAVGTAVVASDGSYSVTTNVLADGSHPLSITATDAAGNQSAPTTIGTWIIDTTAPAVPVLISISDDNGRNPNDRITSDNTLTFTGTAEANSTVTLYGYIHNSNSNTNSTPVVLGTAVVGQNGVLTITTAALDDNLLNERYVFSLDATDTAGNVSGPVSGNDWAISTRIPNPPVVISVSQDTGISSTDKLTKDSTLTITGTGNAGDTITIYDGTTPVGTALVGPDGKWTVTTSVLADGGHNLDVTATSPLGFEGLASSAGFWTIDTVAPSQPVLANNNGLPQVTGSADPGTTVSVVIGGATYTTLVDQNGNWTINLITDVPASGTAPAINTGTFPISVYSTDAAGNSTTPSSSNLVVTTTVQPAPVFTSNPTTSDTTPLITGNSEIGSTVTLTLLDANNVVIATYSNVPTTSAGTWSVNLQTAIPDGGTTPIAALVDGNSYNLSATATDANNQFTSVAATQKLVIDTTAPNTPVITSPTITNDSTPLFTGTAEPGSMIELTIKLPNGSSVTLYQTVTSPLDPNNPSAPGTWAIDFSKISPSAGFLNDLADGNYVVEVVAIDAALNRSPAAVQNPFTVDTVAPLAPVITSPSLTNDNTPVIAGTAEPNSTITLVIDGFTFTTQTNSSGQWSVDLQTAVPVGGSTPITALTDGVYPVTVTATDAAGNTSAPTTQNLRVDTTPPATPEITSGDKTNDTTPVITGLAEPGSTVALTINGATFNTIASPNGTWSVDLGTAIPNGGTTPIAPLNNGQTYPVFATATDAAGNTSAAATQSLLVDTTAPDAPVFTSSALTNQVPPTITGIAEPNSTLTLVINGATYNTPVDANGNWSVNTATATPISGTLGTFTDGNYPVSAYCTDSSNNQSGTSAQTLVVDLTAPVVTSAVASFGTNLNLDESKANATIAIAITGIEDGQPASVTINGSTFSGTVFNGKVLVTVPAATLDALADGTSPTFTVSATDRAGNTGTMAVQFSVDKSGPPRPSIVSVTSSQTDPNPGDLFTSIVNPTVVLSGQAGQTVVIHGPNGIVNPADYTVTESNGLYTITFTTNQVRGDYQVNLRDANGNENADGAGAQNFFRIDSVPILFDNPLRRSTTLGSTYGNLGAKNILNGQVFNVPQQSDNTWVDLDGENLTFGLAGSTVIETDLNGNPTLLEISINGAVLQLNPITGAYKYTPVPLIDRMDTFVLTLRDTSGNQTQLQLTFNSIDTLDRDGVGSASESILAGIVTGTGDSTNLAGDLNRDGVADANQNSVTTLAWRKEADYLNAINPNTASSTDRAAVVVIVVNSSVFDPNTTTTLTQLMGNVDPLAQLLQIQVTNSNGLIPDSKVFYKPWDLMNFSVESLISTGLTDVNPDRPGTQIQVAIDISNANMPLGGFGFSLYRKYVSQQTLDDYAQAGITLRDLDNNVVTTPNWYDYTQRTAGGDGASFKDFNNDGKIDAIIVTLTDNAFGDDSPVRNKIIDPGTPSSNFPPNPGGNNPAVPTPPGSNPPAPAPTSFAATGTSTGSVPGTTVNIYSSNNTTPSTVLVPFENWQGEVRIVRADLNADGNLETIATMGEGGLPILRVFDGVTGAQTMEIQVYDRAFTGGIFVAVGDLGNDGILDFVTGAGQGGGPHVKIFNALTGLETSSFMAYDINFRGGVSVAVGDIDGSGFPVIVTGAGKGGGPHVKVFNGTDHSLIKQFMAYATTFSGGVYVAVGDYLSDGKYEIITGAGAGGGPHIKIWDYETLNLDGQTMAFTDFTKDNGEVIDVIFNGGVRVALADANGDNVLDILAGAGPSGGPRVQVFVGFRLELLMDFFTGDKKDGRGVFVSQ